MLISWFDFGVSVKKESDKMKVEEFMNLVNRIRITKENEEDIEKIKKLVELKDYRAAVKILEKLRDDGKVQFTKTSLFEEEQKREELNKEDNTAKIEEDEEQDSDENEENSEDGIYPKELSNIELEEEYIGLLLENPKAISMYYIVHDDCYFESEELLNIYKSILFTEGQAYAPQIAKDDFNFPKEGPETYHRKKELKNKAKEGHYDFEKVYVEIAKLFVIRKNYLANPIKETKEKIVEVLDYKLYNQMTVQEVKDAIEQINATEKFKRAVLNNNITNFLLTGENSLTSGLALPFPILSGVFKGIRKGETMAYAMPSNSGKSRLTIDIAAYIAFIHNKKVLIISNEMSEEKMKLCLITTVLNNKEIQKLHGQEITKTEGELLEFKFRPDEGKKVEVDEDGYVKKQEGESQSDFAKRLIEVSTEFNKTIAVTDWIDKQIKNSIYFVNITNHTNEELEKVILNYYYKEKIEYMFYDTLKTDTEHIGNGEEIKKTATILSNLAQNLNIFIASSLQLTESNTLPINLNINDLAVSRTVKEVLDTLCLMKQIHNEDLDKYEYSLEEEDTKFYELKKYKNPDVRYYACVVDKNRAGAKPKVLFRLNLAYNIWEELGYLRLK